LAGFCGWVRWDVGAISDAPDLPGVYAFRLHGRAFGRLKGESDLVYIGCADSVKRRLSGHLPARAEALECAGRLRDVETVGALEVAWRPLGSAEEAKDEEARLLRHYYWDHIELPPVNRGEPARFVRKAIKHLGEHHPVELAEKAVEYVIRETHGPKHRASILRPGAKACQGGALQE
jgi:hypothetical protein